MNDFPDPFQIDVGVGAVGLEQRNRDAGNGCSSTMRKGFLQNRKAAYAHDRLDLAGLDDRHDDCRALGTEHRITQSLSFLLKILNRAKAALFAEEPELIEGSRAFALDAQALGHEQEAALVGNRRELLAPGFVID